MDSLTIGFTGIGCVLLLLAFRVPVGVALGIVPLVGLSFVRSFEAAMGILGSAPFDFAASWSLSAVPMFLLMGAFAFHSNITSSLYDAARLWLGKMPGGIAIATNFACAGFAAASGSSLATAAAMGRIAIPEMLRLRYDAGLATAVAAAGGTLGALIPPSIMIVIFGWLAEVSIGKLLIAGVIPGLLTAVAYAGMIYIRCLINPKLAPRLEEVVTWPARFAALGQVWPVPVLILAIIGGIYGGVVSPTEAGAFGAFVTLLLGLVRGGLDRQRFFGAFKEALRSTASIFFVAIGAILFTRFLGYCGVPNFLAGAVREWGVDPLSVVLVSSLIYLVLGMFLDPLGILLLSLPILLPVYRAMDIDLIWMGIILIKYIEISLLTPPVGLNVFVIKSVVGDSVPVTTIFRGLFWFLMAEVVVMTLLISFPQITLFLPDLMGF